MTNRFFDSIVIGAGQAGTPLAVRLAEAGHRTLLVEREHVGGTCVNDGCTPTKAMVASARAAHVARTAAAFGVSTGPVSVDMAVVKARTKTIVQASIDGLREWIARTEGLEYLAGHARFTGPRSLSVGADTYEARRMFINVGARTSIPPIPGLETVRHLTNATIIELAEIPEHLIVVGGSYIGLEFAQMFRRFGARVTVVEQGARLIAREDPDVSDTIRSILEGEGIAFHLGAADLAASGTDDAVHLALSTGGRHLSLSGSHLLIAAGRRPNTDDLGLEKAGVAVDAKGFVEVDDGLRTSVEGIWALGDVNGRGAFTHTSWNDYEIVAANLLDGEDRKVSDRIPVYGLFIDPPLGRVGMTEAQAASGGRRVLRGVMQMARVGRARERGETLGFMKVLVDADSAMFLGAAFLGIEGDEAVHGILDLMAAGVPYTSLLRTMHIHPTVSELIPTLLSDLHSLRRGTETSSPAAAGFQVGSSGIARCPGLGFERMPPIDDQATEDLRGWQSRTTPRNRDYHLALPSIENDGDPPSPALVTGGIDGFEDGIDDLRGMRHRRAGFRTGGQTAPERRFLPDHPGREERVRRRCGPPLRERLSGRAETPGVHEDQQGVAFAIVLLGLR